MSNHCRALINFHSHVRIDSQVVQKLRHHSSLPAALNFWVAKGNSYGHGLSLTNYKFDLLIPEGTRIFRSSELGSYIILSANTDPHLLPFESRKYQPTPLTPQQLSLPSICRMRAKYLTALI
jgi:hypothetical protein